MDDREILISTERLFSICAEKSLEGEQTLIASMLSQATYSECWNSLSTWLVGQMDSGRIANFQGFGLFGYIPNLEGKIVGFKPDYDFAAKYGLVFNQTSSENLTNFTVEASTKVNLAAVAKLSGVDKAVCTSSIMGVIGTIGTLLSAKRIEIDLGVLGKLRGKNSEIVFLPMYKAKGGLLTGKSSVKKLIEMGKSYERLPPLERLRFEVQPLERLNPKEKLSKTTSRVKLADTRSLSKEMLAAGLNPQARVICYSSLASNPQELLNTKFKKPPLANTKFPPVLDIFSRTQAAPMSFNKQYMPVSARIATFYSPNAKRLIIDKDTHTIKYAPEENIITLFTNINPRLPMIPSGEGLPILAQGKDEETLKKDYNWKRYTHYIENEISQEVIAPINQVWVHNILDLVAADWTYIEKSRVEELLDQMLNDINKDYYLSGRKSIFDYVLKDFQQMRRLGIEKNPNPPVEYGEQVFCGIEPSEEWQRSVMEARMHMSDNLCTCNPATLGLKIRWTEFENMLFVYIPARYEITVIEDFIEKVDSRMAHVHSLLVNDWIQSAHSIIVEEAKNMDKEQAAMFFSATNSLMSVQLRQLITDSIVAYMKFFQSFEQEGMPQAEEMIENIPKRWPNAFLNLRMVAQDGKVTFSDNPEYIVNELINIVYKVAKISKSITQADQFDQIDSMPPKNSRSPYLFSMESEDEIILEAVREIEKITRKNQIISLKSLSIYEKYSMLLTDSKRIDAFIHESHTRKEYSELIRKYELLEQEIRKTCPLKIRLNLMKVDCRDLNKTLCKECESIINKLTGHVLSWNTDRALKISKEFESMNSILLTRAESEKKLVESEDYKEKCREVYIPQLFEDFNDVKAWFYLLYDTPLQINEDNLIPLKTCNVWVKSILDILNSVEIRLQNEKDVLVAQLREVRKGFNEELNAIEQEINKHRNDNVKALHIEICGKIANLKVKLEKATRKMEEINEKETLLGWSPTEFTKLEDAKKNIEPYDELWTLVSATQEKFSMWTITLVKELDPDEIEREIKMMQAKAKILIVRLKEKSPKPAEVAQQILNDIEKFMKNIPVMKIVSTRGLEERHFEKITKILGKPMGSFRIDANTTFRQVQNLEIDAHMLEIEEIALSASREFSNLRMLERMEKEWANLKFEVKERTDTKTYILLGAAVEIIQALLEEQILTIQTMKGSPFAAVYISRINDWDDWLTMSEKILSVWLKVQSFWIGLEPVFASADIQRQLIQETAHFKEVDSQWKRLMEHAYKDLTVTVVTRFDGLFDTLTYCLERLEIVQKGLNNYLENKRAVFPRFYFLSNEELLSILKETRDPTQVQPHLKKCFEGIKSLRFDEEHKISAMISPEGELIEVDIIDPAHAEGAVEKWLLKVEDTMLKSTHAMILRAIEEYTEVGRKEWVADHKGQAVLCASMREWTANVEAKIYENNGLEKYFKTCDSLLGEIVNLVRGEIPDLVRCTLKALIVLDVHCRDVVQELISKSTSSRDDFAWQCQLRYYCESDNNIIVKIINARLEYTYEYLGNSERLVITPLTDRCYRTLCGAISLFYGGAPEGPAGTGKTETVKDLAKALARMCVVFNCSDGLDYKAMGKFFKGLASTGGWCCLDEFNRIDPEVLSVVAQQLLLIQNAVRDNLTSFDFEGTVIALKKTCNCFITMNPGYAGRSELPDNLKALFRTVAMMVPDYSLIAENVLYSYGFHQARVLAQKIVATYKLCSEQLSSQKHYDYGMRAVKSVLTVAGSLKRRYPDESEVVLMLRSINDVNLAKFLAQDLPLFEGIISDLFPGIVLPEPDYVHLKISMSKQSMLLNLQEKEYFTLKVIQLYEMVQARHGLMVVGSPFAGKSSAIKVLAGALDDCAAKGLMNENKVLTYLLNPKSITLKQLYGSYDEISKDWQDGVLSFGFKTFARNETKQRKWLHFDGPVDALWIENMNTVLDDNKKLCLPSGEIVAMSQNMNLIFEVMDLAVASPATVSRCGMIYMEPSKLGWEPIFQSWKKVSLPKTFFENEELEVNLLVDWLIEPTLKQISTKLALVAPTSHQNLVNGLLRIFADSLKYLDNQTVFDSIEEKDRIKVIDCLFIYSMVWSIGACVVDRRSFNIWLRRILNGDVPEMKNKGKKIQPLIPDSGSYYDYVFLTDVKHWKHWAESGISDINEPISNRLHPNQVIVPTTDTIRYTYLLEKMIKADIPHLFCGRTGTGKTVYIKDVLLNKLESHYTNVQIGFSAQTSANSVQDTIDSKLDVKRGKGVFGPRPNEFCVIFIDDMNMPESEEYGAQPPIEILRQFLDQGGWYDRKDNSFRKLIDCRFTSAMGTPGGGRAYLTPRFMRHISMISLNEFEDDTLNRIFSSILHWFFAKNKFTEHVAKVENKLVQASRDVYKWAMEKLLPTPLKSHYTFNLRDFSKVILGICMADPVAMTETDQVVRLWVHEIFRVFGDRLTDESDQLTLLQHVRDITKKIFGMNFDTIFNHLDFDKNGKVETMDEIRKHMFGYILNPIGSQKKYTEMSDFAKIHKNCEQALEQYNFSSNKPMDLVLFSFAIEHLCRVSRILSQAGGHALLVGVGGSGRQSMTRLAANMAEYSIFQVELTKTYGKEEWREDLRTLLKKTGGTGEHTVFLLTDSHIKDKSFLEDINTLLNTGEVPNLFAHEEKVEVIELMRTSAKTENNALDGSISQMYLFFVERCRKMLHIVLCFSPIGEAFRTRLRMFPSLVNCCTIDWYTAWPQNALVSVAEKSLAHMEIIEDVREQCVEMCQDFHSDTLKWSENMLLHLKRPYYVTPTSYLELIKTYKALLAEKRKSILAEKNRFEIGYEKLILTESSVETMRKSLTLLQPQLLEAQKETDKKVVIVEAKKKEAEIMEEGVKEEELIARKAADRAEGIKRECDHSLAECMPILEEALKALAVIEKEDISTIKKMMNPPALIKDIMEAVCILFSIEPPKKQNPNTMKMEPQWWEASLKVLSREKLLKELQDFDKDSINEKQIKQLQKFIQNPDFDKDFIRNNISITAAGLCAWVCAMEKYYHVNLEIQPKLKAQQGAEEEYNKYMRNLEVKENELKDVQSKVADLQEDLKVTMANKEKLEKQVEDCEKRLERAQKLIESLGGEKLAWKEHGEKLGGVYVTLTGDTLIAAGMVAYLGPFTASYRSQIIEKWVANCKKREIPSSPVFSLTSCIGDPVVIRSWNIDGLPKDAFSIENAIIMSTSSRWSLLIDPESQANKWIKKMEGKEENLLILKLADDNFLRLLENKITFGHPVLLENVGEDLDPSLEPLLLKQIVKNILKLGELTIEYNKDFRFYITTRLRNPHYLPELSTKVALINFMITQEGLADQLLVTVVAEEQPELAKSREKLIVQFAENQKNLKKIQDKILHIMSTSSGNILDDDDAINTLSQSKTLSDQIEIEQEKAKITELKIEETRTQYKDFSSSMSQLFFCITELSNIDPMYQYSLDFFNNLYLKSIRETEKSEDLNERLAILQKSFTKLLYNNISRSLFEKDRLLFSFNLALKFMEHRNELDPTELRFLITGGTGLDEKFPPAPASSWLLEKAWVDMCRLSKLDMFHDFQNEFRERIAEWELVFNNAKPNECALPGYWNTKLNSFQKILVLRCLRPDTVINAITDFVTEKLGKEYTQSLPLKLNQIWNDSNRCSPLIFILSPGSDPLRALSKYADTRQKKLIPRSLGQGQGDQAEELINRSLESGDWVLLMNCHLAESWMPRLEQIVQSITPESKAPAKDFRLWLTSYPSPKFPVTLLQNGLKMTNEPPKGLRSNLLGSFSKDFIAEAKNFNGCKKEKEWKKLLFGLCFFNAVIQERRLYGALGWNIAYEFSESDLRISVQQLRNYLDDSNKNVPFEAIMYLSGECNFGGRVTDDKDRRLIMTLLSDYFNEDIFKDTYRFAGLENFFAPPIGDHASFIAHIDSMPSIIPPAIYGFHDNADITKNQNEAAALYNSLLLTQSRESSKGAESSIETTVNQIIKEILSEPPEIFDEELCQRKFPALYIESMNTVFTQEVIRFNVLTKCIKSVLNDLVKAINGQISMSVLLESTMKSLFDGKVPKVWKDVSYPSLKPLGSYITDLKQRLSFFKSWLGNGIPEIFEISRFFFTQSFLTGSLQNYSRKYKIAIDLINFNFEITTSAKRPEDGVIVKGLFLEGARWSKKKNELAESRPKVLYTSCPMIWLKPSDTIEEAPHYKCPVYKTSDRRGELSTTGHSTNFVMFVKLNSSLPESHWTKRGVALLTQLND